MMESFGTGVTGLDTVLGMLGIAPHSGSQRSWAIITNEIGNAQQKVADRVQQENLLLETMTMEKRGIMPLTDGGKTQWPLTVLYDMGWQKRAAGRIYNSSSGHGFLIGAYTNKIIDRTCYSKSCCTCKRNWKKQGLSCEEATKGEILGEIKSNIEDHRCPRNFNGSSKSMEA